MPQECLTNKKCPSCKTIKAVSEFHKGSTSCKACKKIWAANSWKTRLKDTRKENTKKWRSKNPELWKEQVTRANRKKKKYGMTFDERVEFRKQHGKCAICGNVDLSKLVIDHCHITNIIRGVLCKSCNKGIGQIGDTASKVKLAYEYLAQFEKSL
jgi:hypothetical protein